MSCITLAQAQEMLGLYIEAEKAILKGQSYTIKDRTLTRANLSHVVKERKYWLRMCRSLSGLGSMQVSRVVIRDS